jgi:hypothetical protein
MLRHGSSISLHLLLHLALILSGFTDSRGRFLDYLSRFRSIIRIISFALCFLHYMYLYMYFFSFLFSFTLPYDLSFQFFNERVSESPLN